MNTWTESAPAAYVGLVLVALGALVLFRQVGVWRKRGLADHGRFRAASRRALARGRRTGRHTAIVMIDMNEPGDLVLIEFAGLLRRCVPEPGRPARLDGHGFAVVLPDLNSPAQAYEIAGRIAAATGPVMIGGVLLAVAAGIGVAVSGPGELTHDELAHRADEAMRRAKRLGPQTRWAVWQQSFEPESRTDKLAAAA